VIQEVNHRPVRNVAEFEQAMHKAGKEEAQRLSRDEQRRSTRD